jgi:DNA modification methylase
MVKDQRVTSKYAIYNGDSVEIMESFPDECMHLSLYSPPFGTRRGGLYIYSSSERDLSNCHDYATFMKNYEFFVKGIYRITKPGRFSCVHCAEVPNGNSGGDSLTDFPGDIIKLHEMHGWRYKGRHIIWKEPLWVRNRTLTKDLAHATVVENSLNAGIAGADYLLLFQRNGKCEVPVRNPVGLLHYAGETKMPADRLRYRGWTGDQKLNRFSHWIWRQYASSIWDDIRMGNVLPFEEWRDEDDEAHVHPLQKDVVERCCVLRSNPGENVWTPCAGVGTEVCGALATDRRGIGGELKPSYYRQMVKNVEANPWYEESEQTELFAEEEAEDIEEMAVSE